MILHSVFVRFNSEIQAAEKQEILNGIVALKDVVGGILDVKTGPNVSSEGLDSGYADGFVVTFVDSAARDVYLEHPAHKIASEKLVAATAGGISGVFVFDMKI